MLDFCILGVNGIIYRVGFKEIVKFNEMILDILGNFLLAAAFLTSGDFQKSYDLFLKAAKGVYSEQFLIERIANFVGDNANHCVLYFLKVSLTFCILRM